MSDVLETQRAKLVKKLEETKSFETVKEAHEQVNYLIFIKGFNYGFMHNKRKLGTQGIQ